MWDEKPASLSAFCPSRAKVSGNLGRSAEEEKERVSESRWPEAEKRLEKQEFVLPNQQSKSRRMFPQGSGKTEGFRE